MYLGLSFVSIHQQCILFWTHSHKSYRENQIGAWNRSCLWPLIAHQETVSYKPRIRWAISIYLYTFKPMCRTTFKTPWSKVQNLLEIKLTTNVTLLFLSIVNNLCLFFTSQVWTMKVTESTNVCYVSDTVACTIIMNIKETFMGNDSFCKCFSGEWTAVRE